MARLLLALSLMLALVAAAPPSNITSAPIDNSTTPVTLFPTGATDPTKAPHPTAPSINTSTTTVAPSTTTSIITTSAPPNTTTPAPTNTTTPAPTNTTTPAPTNTTTAITPVSTTPVPASSSVKPTNSPLGPSTPPPHTKNSFNGPSFIGGIVLALGMVGIGVVGWKYYKARTERNYRTL